jgi:hypothetical protein
MLTGIVGLLLIDIAASNARIPYALFHDDLKLSRAFHQPRRFEKLMRPAVQNDVNSKPVLENELTITPARRKPGATTNSIGRLRNWDPPAAETFGDAMGNSMSTE